MSKKILNIIKYPKKLLKIPKKFLIIGLIVIVALGFFIIRGNKKPEPILTAKVIRQDIKSTVAASGNLNGKENVNLKFKSGGKLAYLNVKEGDTVTQGQVIAGLDTQDLSITLQQAQNTLRDKQAIVDKIVDDIHLFQYGNGGFSQIGTPNETQAQRQLRTTAEAARDSALDTVRSAQRAFQDTILISPINGTITKINPVAGQNVSSADTITQVVDESEIVFESEVDEADISKINLGQNAEVTLNAYGDKVFKGTVSQITKTTKTTSSGATVVIVKISLNPSAIRFTSGLNGQSTIIIAENKNVLTIPQEALRENNTVIVKKDNSYHPVNVKTGLTSDTDIEIKEGLQEGDEIVKNPSAVRMPQQRSQNPINRFFRGLTGGRRI